MKSIILDKRLHTVASELGEGHVLADIGSDHAYLPIYLLQNKKIERAIITDVNPKPLEKGIENVTQYQLNQFCDFRLGSGFDVLKPDEADLISICGMGGELISSLIQQAGNVIDSGQKLVLQPMSNAALLRKTVIEMGFRIINEKMVRDKHLFYQVIVVIRGHETYYSEEIDFEFPKLLRREKDAVMKEYLLYQLNVQHKIYAQLRDEKQSELLKISQNRIDTIGGLLKEYESE